MKPVLRIGLGSWGGSAAVPLRADFLNNIAPPHFYSFSVWLLLDILAPRGVIGARRSSRTHFLLLVLMLIFAVHRNGRRLALDAIVVARWRSGASSGASFLCASAFASLYAS